MEKITVSCEMEITVKTIGGIYKPLILYYLYEEGVRRFGEILRFVHNASQRTLTNQLRELEKDGLIQRKVYAEIPPKVEYCLTEKGKSLVPILEAMCEWGVNNCNDRYIVLNPQCGEG